ncbi:MAG TPA: hypothetical protein VLK33_01405 [Terriglobales bacterium]|nr:hypothetical protein [Terriglobales bacterium]
MNAIVQMFKQNRQVWAWAVIISLLLILLGHAPAMPIITGGLLAVLVTSLRAMSHGQKKPWQTRV